MRDDPETQHNYQHRHVRDVIARKLRKASFGAGFWSFFYHFVFMTSVVMSGLISVLSQSGFDTVIGVPVKFAIASLSAAAAMLTAIAGVGGFRQKWRANRRTRTALEGQLCRLDAGIASPAAVLADVQKILGEHDEAIGNSDTEPAKSKN